MKVTFRKRMSRRMVEWEVVTRSRRHRPRCSTALGTASLPHDLEQLVVEAAIGANHGFWGSVADRADAITSPRRDRSWRSGGLLTATRAELNDIEHLVNVHVALANQGRPTPAAEPLARFRTLWSELGDGEAITVEWPTLRVVDAA